MSELLGIDVRRALADGVAARDAFDGVRVSSVPTGGALPAPCAEFGDQDTDESFATRGQGGTGIDENGTFTGVIVTEATAPESTAEDDTTARAAEDDADALFGDIEDLLAADRTLGGTCLWCRVTGAKCQNGVSGEATRVCSLTIRFEYKARANRGG